MEWVITVFILGLVAFGIFFLVSIHNDLVTAKSRVKSSWAHIDVQLQRRFDLIPNIVETVRSFAIHEKQLLENMSNTRHKYANAHTNKEKLLLDKELNSNLNNLYILIETYPQLKSDAQFLKAQEVLAEIEEDIAYARQFYNEAVTIYNNKLMLFPNNIIAGMFNFKEEVLFEYEKNNRTSSDIHFRMQKHFETMKCPTCGATITKDSISCAYCGCSLT